MQIVVGCRVADKRVGSNIYIVFIQRCGVDNAIAGADSWAQKGVTPNALHSYKCRVGRIGELSLGPVKDFVYMKGLAATERAEGEYGGKIFHSYTISLFHCSCCAIGVISPETFSIKTRAGESST